MEEYDFSSPPGEFTPQWYLLPHGPALSITHRRTPQVSGEGQAHTKKSIGVWTFVKHCELNRFQERGNRTIDWICLISELEGLRFGFNLDMNSRLQHQSSVLLLYQPFTVTSFMPNMAIGLACTTDLYGGFVMRVTLTDVFNAVLWFQPHAKKSPGFESKDQFPQVWMGHTDSNEQAHLHSYILFAILQACPDYSTKGRCGCRFLFNQAAAHQTWLI